MNKGKAIKSNYFIFKQNYYKIQLLNRFLPISSSMVNNHISASCSYDTKFVSTSLKAVQRAETTLHRGQVNGGAMINL